MEQSGPEKSGAERKGGLKKYGGDWSGIKSSKRERAQPRGAVSGLTAESGATTVGTGGDWSPNLKVGGTNSVLVPQLFGRSFQQARNFTASIVTSQ